MEIRKSIESLDGWIQKNGWVGYDPYDIRGIQPFMLLQKNKPLSGASNILIERFPTQTRKIFFVKKEINAKAMALFARGYLRLYKSTEEERYLEKAQYCLNWLLENHSKGYSGLCWGYPFNWASIVYVPRGTPSSVVTSNAISSFLDAYEILKEERYLETAEKSCNFITKNLNIDRISEDKICFSYTPLDKSRIHNANLLCAAALVRTNKFLDRNEYAQLGEKSLNYSINEQNPDGSWYYRPKISGKTGTIDNYHTGFVLESINEIRRILGNKFKYNEKLEKGLNFYIKNLLLEDGRPRYTIENEYPIDIHGCAQSIITLSELGDFRKDIGSGARKTAEWTINNMQDKKGFFYYRKYKNHRLFKNYTDKTPYIRWNQAWMLRALSYFSG